jgi:hypothetical protein
METTKDEVLIPYLLEFIFSNRNSDSYRGSIGLREHDILNLVINEPKLMTYMNDKHVFILIEQIVRRLVSKGIPPLLANRALAMFTRDQLIQNLTLIFKDKYHKSGTRKYVINNLNYAIALGGTPHQGVVEAVLVAAELEGQINP